MVRQTKVPSRTMSLLSTILAMDAYNRGIDAKLNVIGDVASVRWAKAPTGSRRARPNDRLRAVPRRTSKTINPSYEPNVR
jgi:hypothetical protein